MKTTQLIFLTVFFIASCSTSNFSPDRKKQTPEIGGDFSIMKKMEDYGGAYKVNGKIKEGFQIFRENGYTWARLRLFHTPNHRGPVCNDLKYTIQLAQKAKNYGFKILLNFHYSDTWADPSHQIVPAIWKDLNLQTLSDSVYSYTKMVVETMDQEGVLPDMIQIGNEINNGMMWPAGKLGNDKNTPNWDALTQLLKAGINGAKEAKNGKNIPILIHAATGGSLKESDTFYKNIIQRGVEFEFIGLSYYPWWHGTFEQLEENLKFLSANYKQDLVLVETAYYSNGFYPEPAEWVLDVQPFPPTEQGQYDFMVKLLEILKKYPKMKTVYYWKPDGMDIPESKSPYLGRSLFDREGNAFKGIEAWKSK
ncbi:arabinogalactan endo-1,4-beta-galactosidase [Maribellus comscasis]|uniref:Arabinogalactan endo-beta-1,4-galactanase n=1 Tax=Maribellus comscasis TaxID=2681766 RepID=A0A6I6K6S4_9BACT|nr:glycosyl hydrolase 53 family protein [Maribellus comscasis]QGY47373.1 arabinogalactan endo-1,4-beta-galactosidase [Maribellus comscasis]